MYMYGNYNHKIQNVFLYIEILYFIGDPLCDLYESRILKQPFSSNS